MCKEWSHSPNTWVNNNDNDTYISRVTEHKNKLINDGFFQRNFNVSIDGANPCPSRLKFFPTCNTREQANIPSLKSCQLIKQIKRTSQFPFLKNFPCSVIDATNIDSPIPCEESGTRNEILRRFTFHAKDKDHNHTRTSFEMVYH